MLRIVETILQLLTDVAPLVEKVRAHDSKLAEQLQNALNSTLLNTAEGSGLRGGRRTQHYLIALGSARESAVALRAAEAWRFIGPIPNNVRESLRAIEGTLVKVAIPR